MKVRLFLTGGAYVDAEKWSSDLGATWQDITPEVAAASLNAVTGLTVVNDLVTGSWRALRLSTIQSIGPAGDTSEIIDREVERRIQETLQGQLPKRAEAVTEPATPPTAAEPDEVGANL